MPSIKLRRPKEPETSKEEYLQAALELFIKKGYYLTSVDEIVKRAKRSKGGFYHHFKSKNDLLRAFFEKMMNQYGTIFLDEVKRGKTIEQAFDFYIRSLPSEKEFTAQYTKAVAELYAIALRDKGIRELLLDFHRQSIRLFEQVFTIAKARGEMAFAMPAHELAEMIYTEIRGAMLIKIILYDSRDLYAQFYSYIERLLLAYKPRP